MYLDTSYIVKFYCNEPESPQVRDLVRKAEVIYSSLWAFAEFHAVLHRRAREDAFPPALVRQLASRFEEHVEAGLWNLIPVTESLLRRTSTHMITAPPNIFLRTADAVHLATALQIGETDVWTNDRHMRAAAPYFALTSRSVSG